MTILSCYDLSKAIRYMIKRIFNFIILSIFGKD